jgi:hypothetical protein
MGWKTLLAYITGSVDQELEALVRRKVGVSRHRPA